ncbi:MAG: xanthine dehydrogenase family protein subunit M, partial [Actinomyces sp.]
MIPAAFDYVRAESPDHALELLAEHGDEAKLLAGGHSLIPLMKYRLAAPGVIVDIGRLAELSYIRDEGDHLAIGALTRHRDVETSDLVAAQAGLLADATHHVGDPQVRHRGTIGGSIAHGDPASDIPSALLALRATMVVRGADGTREVAADDFFTGFLETAVGETELLTEIRVPKVPGARWSFQKFNRRAQDWAIVGASVLVADGDVGIGLVNMDSRPIRA